MVDILFVHPNASDLIYQDLSKKAATIEPPIWAYSRIDTCKPEYLETLKKAGVVWLGLGIENPSNIIRKEVHKNAFKEVKILDIIRQMQSSGINVAANYIFGLPNENEESMKFTLDFALEAKS
jgi:anaerobic magnesium-protoporphyrin IX monomethyl ester cyclase|tara:strand:- start:2853 stop:3221 length:369 start_codon:yes stop_codon:yes gene_type:complete